jgi:hypothetical protein
VPRWNYEESQPDNIPWRERGASSWNHHQKRAETERGCVRSTSRSGTARPRVLGSFEDFGHPHLLRLVLRTQPRSGGGSKLRPHERKSPKGKYHVLANNASADFYHYPDSNKWGFLLEHLGYFRLRTVNYYDGEE